jgi:hypothetical protein
MTKSEALQALTFGQRIAEEEREQLASYFVETDLWRRMLAGEVDIVYGAKGSGKSAIYALLLDRDTAFRERGILIRAADILGERLPSKISLPTLQPMRMNFGLCGSCISWHSSCVPWPMSGSTGV